MSDNDPSTHLPKPTEGELGILQVLWQRGPSTVAEILQEFQKARETGYTTVLKLLQIMTDKGLVSRDKSLRAHVYSPTLSEEQTQRQLLGDLVDRAFSGSASRLVLRALSTQRATPDELAKIRELLDSMESEAEEGAEE